MKTENKRFFKMLAHPDFFGVPGEMESSIPINRSGGIVLDPNRRRPGIHFTDIKNIGYYYTYGNHFVEIFPIPGIEVKSCKDDDGKGWRAPKVRYGPVQRMTVKDMCWFITNGADVTMSNGQLMYDTLTMLSEHPTNIWVRKMFQAMMVQLSNKPDYREEFDLCWVSAKNVLGNGIYLDLYEMLKDRRFNISIHSTGFGFIEDLRHLLKKAKNIPYFDECIHQLLLRLRIEYPDVYFAAIQYFLDYQDYVKSVKDPEGFTYLIPVYDGPYYKYRTKIHEDD